MRRLFHKNVRRNFGIVAITWLSGLTGLYLSAVANASEIARQTTANAKSLLASQARLPICVNAPDQIREIEASLKKDPVTKRNKPQKYGATIAALAASSDSELLARLIYAETRAAHCPELQDEVAMAIQQVIKNRIAKREGKTANATKSVVFEIDQFASSLNKYEESQWREFLCPSDPVLWAKAVKLAQPEASNSSGLPSDAHNYYLYKHAGRFSPPRWAQGEGVKFAGSTKLSSCIKVFRLPFK